ncbi:MAG: hypothetical protein ACYCOU_25645 [Sulfobacillus sp.]
MAHSPLTLEHVQAAFKQWRTTKRHGSTPIPQALWEQVAQLLEHYPKSQVLNRLGISTQQFKAKVKAPATEPAMSFISVPLTPTLYPLELTLPKQIKLTLQLPVEQVGTLVRELMQV